MRIAAKLDEWRAAGLIDDASAAAIRSHEDGRQRPVAQFAVVGLGLLAVALGIVSLVAANWDEVPAWVKLAVHLALMAAVAVAALRLAHGDRVWAGEGALFLLAALTLAGIALHGQVYQLNGPLWEALAWWALFTAPAILLLGRTALTACALGIMLGALALAYGAAESEWLGWSLMLALPAALVLAALAPPENERGAAFRDGLFGFGLFQTLAVGSAAHIGWADASSDKVGEVLRSLPVAAIVVAGACVLAFRRRPHSQAWLVATVLAGSLVAAALALGLPHERGMGPRLFGLASFMALWGGIAAAATRAGWHGLFRVAVAALALRLFIVYFELFHSLAFTGVGLILAGALLLLLAWGWTRVVRREAR